MRDLDHALTLIEATVGATRLPVTLKMRLGWDENTINAPELARRAEAAGVQMVTVHGRTRCQFYGGSADWSAIRAVRDAITIPLIANGDLESIDQLETMLALSGADGIMIGRGAYGRPWFPGDVAGFVSSGHPPAPLGDAAIVDRMLRHYEGLLDLYGPVFGARVARKHLGWYCDRHGFARAASGAAMRARMMQEDDTALVRRMIAALSGAELELAA
jgi:tRNA-dihydrouridine synthase B